MYCLVGDGESAEGSIWEALSFASYYKLDNLVAVFDVNRLGQSKNTMLDHDLDTYRARLTAFGYAISCISFCLYNSLARAFLLVRHMGWGISLCEYVAPMSYTTSPIFARMEYPFAPIIMTIHVSFSCTFTEIKPYIEGSFLFL